MSVSPDNLPDVILPTELDELLRLPPGRSARLARRGLISAIVLPGGRDVRFKRETVERLLSGQTPDLFPHQPLRLAGAQ